MKHISILVPRGAAVLNCIEGSYMLFSNANRFLESMGRPPLFTVELVGIDREEQIYEGLFRVRPNHDITELQKTDLIIIPPVNGCRDYVVELNREFFPWITGQYKNGAEVASLCVGAFLLASTGLLAGRRCATHWNASHDFRKMFPDVKLVSDKVITDEQGVYSSGGANSFWNLLLYLLEKYTDREVAILAAKYFELEIDRTSQSPFIIFSGQRDHDDEMIRKVQEFVERNYAEKFTIEQLASIHAMSRRNLERRFKKATSNSIIEYIQRVKIEAAKKGLETGRKSVGELMFEVGYSDTKAFRTIFKKITGLSPVEYRNKYNRS